MPAGASSPPWRRPWPHPAGERGTETGQVQTGNRAGGYIARWGAGGAHPPLLTGTIASRKVCLFATRLVLRVLDVRLLASMHSAAATGGEGAAWERLPGHR